MSSVEKFDSKAFAAAFPDVSFGPDYYDDEEEQCGVEIQGPVRLAHLMWLLNRRQTWSLALWKEPSEALFPLVFQFRKVLLLDLPAVGRFAVVHAYLGTTFPLVQQLHIHHLLKVCSEEQLVALKKILPNLEEITWHSTDRCQPECDDCLVDCMGSNPSSTTSEAIEIFGSAAKPW